MRHPKPPFIDTAEKGSFARYTLENRFPAIIDGVLKKRLPSEPSAVSLEGLKEEVRMAPIVDPFAEDSGSGRGLSFDRRLFLPEEIAAWQEEIAPRLGRFWREVPFYFVEAYLYLRILIASGYYDRASPYFDSDPFGSSKEEELGRLLASRDWEGAVRFFLDAGGRAKRGVPQGEIGKVLEEAVLFMLKGNRIDLSNEGIAERGRRMVHRRDRTDLLVDHLEPLSLKLFRARRVDIILDNAGAELTTDLVFSWYFLSAFPESRLVLHAKRAPLFVSDAMVRDVAATVSALGGSPVFSRIGEDLAAFEACGRFVVRDHFFWNGPKHFSALPPEISSDLAGSDLVLIKGDANYRRMLEDRKWPFDTNLEDAAPRFPAAFAVLRTLKSEVAADIPRELSQKLFSTDPGWLTNGHWGIVRVAKGNS